MLSKKRRLSLAVVGLVAVATLFGGARTAQAAEPVTLGRICFQNPTALSTKLQALVEKFVPGQGQMVAMGMQQMMNQTKLAGVDWTKPVSVAFFSGKAFGQDEPAVVLLIHLTDAEKFRAAQAAADAMGGPKFAEARGNLAVLSDTQAALAAVTEKRLALYSAYPKIAAGTDVYFTFYISRTLTEYQADIDGGLTELEQQMGNMPPQMAMIGPWLKLIGPMVKFGSDQFHRVSLMGSLAADSIDVSGRLYPVADSQLAQAFATQPTTPSKLGGYLPDNLAMGMSINMDIQKLRPLIESLLGIIAPAMEMEPAKLTDLVYASTQTGEAATGLTGDPLHPGLVVAQVVAIADGAKYLTAAKSVTEQMMQGGIGKMLNAMGMKVTMVHEAQVREHNGVKVDRLTATFAQAEGAAPNPAIGAMPPQVTEMAAVGTLGFGSTNNEAGDVLNAMLDKAKAGAPGASKDFAKALAAAPPGTSGVFFLRFNTMMSKAMEQAAKQQPMMAMVAGIFKADPAEEPILGNQRFVGGRMHFGVRVPHQPFVDLFKRVQMMMGGMRGGGARPAGPPPKRGNDF